MDMGGFLRDGEWITKEKWEQSEDGHFKRQVSVFRDWITQDPEARFQPGRGRYHLYVSLACPWAHRTLIVRALKGLEDAISVSVVEPYMGDDGWTFDPDHDDASTPDHLFGFDALRHVYTKADPTFSGRVTVPVLWDRETHTIVNNESSEIIRMLDQTFGELSTRDAVLYPEPLRAEIDAATDAIYEPINNGVYRCGFASKASAYAESFEALFDALDHWDAHLATRRYMVGDQLTLADVCMFTTLVRFDPVYYVHFKTNRQLIAQFPNLSGYVRDIYQTPGVAETVDLFHIKQHYYRSHTQLNPKGFVPLGPALDLDAPHGRGELG
jgi:putative glutathione S-transferase